MNSELELLVVEGPLAGRRFNVSADGLRLGRSGSCEISISDPALSRSHCLFEARDGGLWVTDLASANGTFVNEEQLGTDSRQLQSGDEILVGDSVIRVDAPGKAAPMPDPVPAVDVASAPALPKIDLGLSGGGRPSTGETSGAARPSRLRLLLWCVALVSVLGALALIFLPISPTPAVQEAPIPDGEGELLSFMFEKVEANTAAVFRCAYAYKDRILSVEFDDVPEANRHVVKTVELNDAAHKQLSEILSAGKLGGLAPEYVGTPSESGSLKSFKLHVVRSSRAFDVSIENSVTPQAFQDICGRLEDFAKSELGIWAIYIPVDQLLERSAAARRVADERWGERGETNYEKYDEALQKYKEALQYLETVTTKPAHYEETREQCRRVKEEIDRIYGRLRGNVDQALGTQNWEQARTELQNIRRLVPDVNDDRYKKADSQLLELEARIKSRR